MIVEFLLLFLLGNSILFVVVGVVLILRHESKPRRSSYDHYYEYDRDDGDDFEWEE